MVDNDSWYVELDEESKTIETVVICNTLAISFPSPYTLQQIVLHKGYFNCPHVYISRKHNVCCTARGGNRCPTYPRLKDSNPPAYPITRFTEEK